MILLLYVHMKPLTHTKWLIHYPAQGRINKLQGPEFLTLVEDPQST